MGKAQGTREAFYLKKFGDIGFFWFCGTPSKADLEGLGLDLFITFYYYWKNYRK